MEQIFIFTASEY